MRKCHALAWWGHFFISDFTLHFSFAIDGGNGLLHIYSLLRLIKFDSTQCGTRFATLSHCQIVCMCLSCVFLFIFLSTRAHCTYLHRIILRSTINYSCIFRFRCARLRMLFIFCIFVCVSFASLMIERRCGEKNMPRSTVTHTHTQTKKADVLNINYWDPSCERCTICCFFFLVDEWRKIRQMLFECEL